MGPSPFPSEFHWAFLVTTFGGPFETSLPVKKMINPLCHSLARWLATALQMPVELCTVKAATMLAR